jgi:branched-chain amino acid transport system permease protein
VAAGRLRRADARRRRLLGHRPAQHRPLLLWNLAYPLALAGLLWGLPLAELPTAARVLIALAIVVPMGPMLYRVAFQPVAEAPVLVLLIISVAVHLAMVGLGLLIFGPEGSRTQPFSEAQFELGSLMVGGHTLVVLAASVVLIVALYLFFDRTLYGKALRATAINRNGARLMGISPALAGRLTFFWRRSSACCRACWWRRSPPSTTTAAS